MRSYREAMRQFADMGNLEVWYSMLTADTLTRALGADKAARQKKVKKRARKDEIKAETKDSVKAFKKLTTVVDGRLQIVSDPPVIVRAVDLMAPGKAGELTELLHDLLRRYRASLADDRRHLLEGYRMVDVARKVVGVGSVGTRCWILLLEGRSTNQDPAVPADQGSRGLGARALRRHQPVREPPSCKRRWRRSSGLRSNARTAGSLLEEPHGDTAAVAVGGAKAATAASRACQGRGQPSASKTATGLR